MPGSSSNGGRSGGRNNGKKQESKVISDLRNACPDHKKGDFDQLVKQLRGDEAKISQKIQEWWEEPHQPQEEKWEEINKKPAPKPKYTGGGGGGGGKFRGERDRDRGGRSTSNGEGRGRGGRGRGGGGRGGGRGDRKFRDDKSGPPPNKPNKNGQQQPAAEKDSPEIIQATPERVGVPKPVTNAPILKGAWGQPRGAPPAPAGPTTHEKPAAQPQQQQPVSAAPLPSPTKKEPVISAVENLDVGRVSKNDPTPGGLAPAAEAKPKPTSGNVWATKGSAHLIQAEKPKPPAPPAPVVVPPTPTADKAEVAASPAPEPVLEEVPVSTMEEPMASLETGLPPAVANSTGAWGSEPEAAAPAISREIPPSPQAVSMAPPVAPVPPVQHVAQPSPSPAKPQPPAPKPPRPAPANVLNMGHWETGDAAEDLDFGFGSFGTENDVAPAQAPAPPTETAKTATPPTTAPVASSAAAAGVSPARPPPGLSIGGMPPMPANAVLVHELETSLENTALNAPKPDQQAPVPQEKPITNPLPPQPQQVPAVHGGAPVLPGQQNYNQYGMAGMYNYNAPGSGFVGVHAPAGPFLGVIPQQQPPKVGANSPQPGATPSGPGSNLPQTAGLYGQPGSAPTSGNAPDPANPTADTNMNGANNNTGAPAPPGMPPGMPGMPPYNPALYYGQQPFHLGQHQAGMGYNYGYGQFGGVQGGFGYQQVMGQGAGYGAPHYADDGQHQQGPPHQGHQGNAHHTGGSGGYQNKSGGGYRGRNNHHNNNQYQNQYNPQQHGGYGGQPYGMGHYNDHFNQRGGYGHANMGDMYGMQQQQQQQPGGIHAGGGGGGFQDDNDHQNKGGRRGGNNRNNNNNSLNQFQGAPHGQLPGAAGQQPPFGLQGNTTDSAQPSTGGAGWSNNNNNNTQAGGWSGAASGWQQGN